MIHQSMDVIQKHFGQRVNQQNIISVFFSAIKIKFLELIVHLHGKILDKQFNRHKIIAMSIILMRMILKFVNPRIKAKIISSLMKQLLIHLVKMSARFLCKFNAEDGMVVHKSTIRLIINFHKEHIKSRKQLMKIMVYLDKVTMTMVQETTSTSVVTL